MIASLCLQWRSSGFLLHVDELLVIKRAGSWTWLEPTAIRKLVVTHVS